MKTPPRTLVSAAALVALVLAGAAQAQGYTPSFGHQTYQQLPPGYTTVWRGDTTPADDAWVEIPIGFPFVYYGTTYNNIRISTNGYLTFPPHDALSHANVAIPGGALGVTRPIIAPWWDDLEVQAHGGTVDEIRFIRAGVAPNETLAVEWRSVSRRWDMPGAYHYFFFEVILYHVTNAIVFSYGPHGEVGLPATGASASVGLQHPSGNCGVTPLPGSPDLGMNSFPSDGTYIVFRPTASTNYPMELHSDTYSALGGTATVLFDGLTAPHPVTGWDDEFADIPIGFNFTYFGSVLTQMRVSTNGYLTTIAGDGTDPVNREIPDPGSPNPVIAPWWDDLKVSQIGRTDQILYELQVAPGARRRVVEWSSVSHRLDTDAVYRYLNFQVHLLEADNSIEFHYGPVGQVGAVMDFTASVGIEDHTGMVGVQSYRMAPNLELFDFPASGTILRFFPPAGSCGGGVLPIGLCGDCNGDSTVDVLDSLVAARAAAGIMVPPEPRWAACNVAGTLGGPATPGAALDIMDALLIAQRAAGLLAALSCAP